MTFQSAPTSPLARMPTPRACTRRQAGHVSTFRDDADSTDDVGRAAASRALAPQGGLRLHLPHSREDRLGGDGSALAIAVWWKYDRAVGPAPANRLERISRAGGQTVPCADDTTASSRP